MGRKGMAVAFVALALVTAGCGDDDEDADEASTETTEASDTTDTTAADEGGGEEASEYCSLAEELAGQEDFPSAAQIERYVELAPEEVSDLTAVLGGPLLAAGDDPVAQFATFAIDDIESAIAELNDFEAEECGVDHSDDLPVGPTGPADGATVVAVTATDYAFAIDPVPTGSVSFEMVNDGAEAHFMFVQQIAEGHTFDEVMASDDPEAEGLITGVVGVSGLAAPGGDDQEYLDAELEAGDYLMLCFIPAADGTPHAFMGMAQPFTAA